MSSRWHYRIDGQDAGPVEFAALQQMTVDSQLLANDEVRAEDSDRWVRVATVPGLLPDAADADDLESMLAHDDTSEPREDRPHAAENCYCRVHAQDLGPMPFAMLAGLARLGRLGRGDQVRIGDDNDWVEAHTVAGLFSQTPTEISIDDEATLAAAAMLDSLEIVPDPTPRKPRARQREHIPAIRMTDDDGQQPVVGVTLVTNENDQWYCRILGQELGPIPWGELQELVKSRQLGPNDRVRKGQTPLWVPAGMIDDLFPSRRQTAAKASQTSHVAPQRSIGRAAAGPTAAPTQRPVQTGRFFVPPTKPMSSPNVAPAAAPPVAAPAKPAAVAARATPPVASAAPSRPVAAAAAAPPAPVRVVPPTPPSPPPKLSTPSAPKFSMPSAPKITLPKVSLPKVSLPRPSLRIGNPFRGLGGVIGGLFSSLGSFGAGGLAGQWKTLVAAVVLFAVAGVMVFGLPRSNQRDLEIYADTVRMWSQAQQLKAGSRPVEWTAFTTVAKAQSKAIATELAAMPTAENQLLKLMLECHRDCLSTILAGSPKENEAEWNAMAMRMDQAKALVPQDESATAQNPNSLDPLAGSK